MQDGVFTNAKVTVENGVITGVTQGCVTDLCNIDNNFKGLSRQDSQDVALSGTGTQADPLKADIKLSGMMGNSAQIKGDGLYVPPGAGISVVPGFSQTLELSGSGGIADPLVGNVKVSNDVGNAIAFRADGLFASPGTATASEIRSSDANNALQIGSDSKLFLEDKFVASLSSASLDIQGLPNGTIELKAADKAALGSLPAVEADVAALNNKIKMAYLIQRAYVDEPAATLFSGDPYSPIPLVGNSQMTIKFNKVTDVFEFSDVTGSSVFKGDGTSVKVSYLGSQMGDLTTDGDVWNIVGVLSFDANAARTGDISNVTFSQPAIEMADKDYITPLIDDLVLSVNGVVKEEVARLESHKVDKAGDTMTGTLKVSGANIELDAGAALRGKTASVDVNIVSAGAEVIGPTSYPIANIGDTQIHTRLATNNHITYGERVTYNTPSGVNVIPARRDFATKRVVYVDPNSVQTIPPNGSEAYPFKTLAAAMADFQASNIHDGACLMLAPGAWLPEQLVIQDFQNFGIFGYGAEDGQLSGVGGISVSGASGNIIIADIAVQGDVSLAAESGQVVMSNCNIEGSVSSAPAQGTGELLRAFESCSFHNDISLAGDREVEFGFYNCWTIDKTDGTVPVLRISNPKSMTYIDGCIDMSIYIQDASLLNIYNSNITKSSAQMNYALYVEDSSAVELDLTGMYATSSSDLVGQSIYLGTNCSFRLGNAEFMRHGSEIKGTFISSGVASGQVRDFDTREFVTPVVYSTDTLGQGRQPNTVKDWFNGISNEFGKRTIDANNKYMSMAATFDGEGKKLTGGVMMNFKPELSGMALQFKGNAGAVVESIDLSGIAGGTLNEGTIVIYFPNWDATTSYVKMPANWNPTTAYVVGDKVARFAEVFSAVTDNTGKDPLEDSVDWAFIGYCQCSIDNRGYASKVDNNINHVPETAGVVDTTNWELMQNGAVGDNVAALMTWYVKDGYTYMPLLANGTVTTQLVAWADSLPKPITDFTQTFTDPAGVQWVILYGWPSNGLWNVKFQVTGKNFWLASTAVKMKNTQTVSWNDNSSEATVNLDPSSNLISTINGITTAAGYQFIQTPDYDKLKALPTATVLQASLDAKQAATPGETTTPVKFTATYESKLTGLQTGPQYAAELATKELLANKVTALSSSSTDDEYPSAKAVVTSITGGSVATAGKLTTPVSLSTNSAATNNNAVSTDFSSAVSLPVWATTTQLAATRSLPAIGANNVTTHLSGIVATLAGLINSSSVTQVGGGTIASTFNIDDGTTWAGYATIADGTSARQTIIPFDTGSVSRLGTWPAYLGNANSRCIGTLIDYKSLSANQSHEFQELIANFINGAYTSVPYIYVRCKGANGVWGAWVDVTAPSLQKTVYDSNGKVTCTFSRELRGNPGMIKLPGTGNVGGAWAHTNGTVDYTFTPTTANDILYGDWSVSYNGL